MLSTASTCVAPAHPCIRLHPRSARAEAARLPPEKKHVPTTCEQVRAYAGGFPTAWAKLRVAEQALKTYEYVLMIDGDAVVMRNDIDLRHAAPSPTQSTSQPRV